MQTDYLDIDDAVKFAQYIKGKMTVEVGSAEYMAGNMNEVNDIDIDDFVRFVQKYKKWDQYSSRLQ